MASNDLELALRIRAAFEGQQALTNLATSFVDINKKVETLMRGLQAISGSAEGAAKEFAYLEETSKKFGLSVLDLADNYVKLSAAAKETNLEGEATRKIFEATASTMAVLGGDTITTERAFRALGQIMSKGQVYAEELKGQLAEAIPGALQIMSRALGISTNEMLSLMEAGQLSADVLLPFATQLEKEYGKLASSSTTFTQAINRIQTEWTLLTKQLGDTGAFKALSNTMNFVGENASVMAGAIGSLATVGLVMLGKGLVSVVGGLTSYVTATRFAANATQQAAVATLAKAEADAQAALAARSNTQAALLSAQANEVAMRGTQLHALAVRELALAQAQATIASNNYVAATKSIQVAQTALIASQGLLSRAWTFMTGPAGLIALTIAGFAAMTYAFRGQDEATKTLSKSTEEYAEELDKLTAAQINLVNARAKEQAADNQSRIDTIKEELEFLYKKIEAERQGIEVNREKSISWYGFKNVLSSVFSTEEQLAKAQADLDEATKNLTITEAKRSIGIGALANQYLLLQKTTQEQQASLNDVNRDWIEQNKIVDASRKTYLDLVNLTGLYSNQSIEAHKNVGQAVEGLQAIEQKRNDQLLLNKNTQTQVNTAIQAYAEETGVAAEAVRAGISGDQQAIDQLDAKSKAIALSVQSLLRLTEEEKALAAQVKLTKSELEKYEKTQLSGVEAKLREAAAIGDLNAIRQAEIEKAKVQQTVAQKSLALEQTILSDKQKQLAIDEQLYQQNEKGRPKTQERIDKLKLEITAQEGVVAQKQADITATEAQAAAVVRANTLIGTSLSQQQQALLATQDELVELRETYQRLSESGESITVLNGLLERLREKEEEVARQSEAMKASIIASFAAVGLSYEEVMTGMDFETQRAIDALGSLASQAGVTSKDIQKAFTNVLSQADTEAEIEALRQKLIELGNNGKLSGEQVSAALLQIRQRAQEIAADPSFASVQESLANLRAETERGIELGNRERESLQDRIQSTLEFANARGKEAEAARFSALATKEVVDQSNLSIQQLQRQQAEIDAHIQRIYAAANANGRYTDAERKVIEALQDQSTAISQNIQQIQAKLPLQQREADMAERMAGSLGQLIRLYQEQTNEHQRNAEVSERYNDVRLKEIEGSIRVAEAQGDEAEAARLQAEQQDVLIEQADQIAANRAQEAADAENAVSIKTMELLADGELSEADQQQIADLEAVAQVKRLAAEEAGNHANALRKEADAGRELPSVWESNEQRIRRMAESSDKAIKDSAANAKAASGLINSFYNSAITVLSSLSEGAVEHFKKLRGEIVPTGDELEVVQQRIEKTEQALARMGTGGGSRFIVWLGQITRDAVTAQKAFLDQATAAERLTEQLESVGQGGQASGGALELLIRRSEEATEQFKLLDETRLNNLQSAIEAANDKIREMQEETQSAQDRLAELNIELLSAQGQDQKSAILQEQLDYQQAIAELEVQTQEAEAEGNQERLTALQQQQSVLDALHRTRLQNIVTEQAKEQDAHQQTTQNLVERGETQLDVMVDTQDAQLQSLDEQAEKTLEAEQALIKAKADAANERLKIEADHLEALDKLDQARKDKLLDEQADLNKALEEENEESAKKVEELYEKTAESIDDLNKDVADSLRDVTQDLAKDLVKVANDLVKDMDDAKQELDRDFFTADRESARNVDEVYRDLDRSIIERQKETQDKLLELEQDRAKDIEELHQDSADQAVESFDSYQEKLLEIGEDLSERLAEGSADLAKSVQEENQSLAESIAELNQETAKSLEALAKESADSMAEEIESTTKAIDELAQDTSKSLEEVTQDTTKAIADLSKDTQQSIEETHADLAKTLVEVNNEAAQSVVELNADTSQALEALYADSRDEVAQIQQAFVDNTQALRDQLVQDALDSTQALADKSEQMRRTLLDKQGESGQVVDAEFGDELQALAKLYAESGEGAKESFTAAIEQAKELYSLQLEEMLKSGDLSKQQYAEAKASMAERLSLTQDMVDEQKALLAEEQNAQVAALSQERDQLLAEQRTASEEKRREINEEAALTSAAIQQEKNEKILAAQEETAEKLRLIHEEQIAKEQALREESVLKQQEIRAEAILQQQSIESESLLKQQAIRDELVVRQQELETESAQRREEFAKESAERQGQLRAEFAERQAKIHEASEQQRLEAEKDHQKALENIQKELEKKLEANRIELEDQKQKARDEGSNDIADARQKAAEKIADLAEELTYKKRLLKEEYEFERLERQKLSEEKRLELEQEAVEQRANIELEKAEKLQAINEEKIANKAKLDEELRDSLLNIQAESKARIAELSKDYKEDIAELNKKTQAELANAKLKADQEILLAQEQVETIQRQIKLELELARAKNLQSEAQVSLNTAMNETWRLTKNIGEQMNIIDGSGFAGLTRQADDLNTLLKNINQVL